MQNRNAAFVKNLFKWITESGVLVPRIPGSNHLHEDVWWLILLPSCSQFREVVILASVDSARRITEAQFWYTGLTYLPRCVPFTHGQGIHQRPAWTLRRCGIRRTEEPSIRMAIVGRGKLRFCLQKHEFCCHGA